MSVRKSTRRKAPRARKPLWKRLLLAPIYLVGGYLAFCTVLLVLYNFITPPITGVMIQRRVEALVRGETFRFRYDPVGRDAMTRHLRHAVVAAEDGRFYEHWGVDFAAVQKAAVENQKRRRVRGGSTITQQLVKNLFMTTHRSYIRKGLELPLALIADLVLPKDRILTMYLNVIEWGKGVYGAEAGARYHYDKGADRLTRRQAASMAACIPAPRRRSPQRMGWYSGVIQRRMTQMGY